MPELVLKGVEHVYDAFDEYEHPNEISLRVTDVSVPEAIVRGQSLLQDLVTRERRAGGYLSTGTFVAELTRIEDAEGYILFQSLEPVKGGLRYFGGDLEDYRDVAARFIFLSYSHKDTSFAEALSKQLELRGLRLWFDRNDIETEKVLLRFDMSENENTKLVRSLERAIDRASWLLLVISSHSVQSKWVEAEVGLAIREGTKARVPIACLLLERTIMDSAPEWVRAAASTSHVYDFSQWQNEGAWDYPLKKVLEEVFRYRGNGAASNTVNKGGA
ncbi:MAG: toll/interleukin-1 receptor domain-containing protein [Kiritimatiellia bacterium]